MFFAQARTAGGTLQYEQQYIPSNTHFAAQQCGSGSNGQEVEPAVTLTAGGAPPAVTLTAGGVPPAAAVAVAVPPQGPPLLDEAPPQLRPWPYVAVPPRGPPPLDFMEVTLRSLASHNPALLTSLRQVSG